MINANIDPITLTVVWNGLISIAEEMGSTLRRTAFSEAVREGDDFSTGLFDAEARLVAQGNFTPGHLGSMPYVIRTVLEYFPRETLKPGDAVLLNDSFLGSGHFPDFFMTSPVFVGDRIVGFVVNTAPSRRRRWCGAGLAARTRGERGVPGGASHHADPARARRAVRRGSQAHDPVERAHAGQGRGRPERTAQRQSRRRGAIRRDVPQAGRIAHEGGLRPDPRRERGAHARVHRRDARRDLQLRRSYRRLRTGDRPDRRLCGRDDQGGRHRDRLLAVERPGAGRHQLLHQLHTGLHRVLDQGVLRRAATAQRGWRPADRRRGAPGFVLQSALPGVERRPGRGPDPHLRRDQRCAQPGAAGTRDGCLLALEQPQHRRYRSRDGASIRDVRPQLRGATAGGWTPTARRRSLRS